MVAEVIVDFEFTDTDVPPNVVSELVVAEDYVLNVCPITEESMDYDWEFTISLDVVLGTLEPEEEADTDEFAEEPVSN